MVGEIKVRKPGLYTTVQDMGRFGFRAYGVPVSGVMDTTSARMAQALVGNTEEEALLEITLRGPELYFGCTTLIAMTGANLSPQIDGKPVEMYQPYAITPGQVLSFGKPINGCRTYLAVKGGFQVEKVMDSFSWYQPVTPQSKLEKGDVIDVIETTYPHKPSHARVAPADFFQIQVEVFPGPEYDQLSKPVQQELISRHFHISNQAGRMGYRLKETLEHYQPQKDLLTSVVLPGTVQLTSGGGLIVLMRDCQTTGGYPRVLQLTKPAIDILAQKKPGDRVRFCWPG